MSELLQKQIKFVRLINLLIAKAYSLGYEITFGEAFRPPEQAALMAKQKKGIKNSLHTLKLAIDLNLYKDGVYLTTTEDHRQLGEFWESVGGSWGGRFNDGNHYSLEHNGIK